MATLLLPRREPPSIWFTLTQAALCAAMLGVSLRYSRHARSRQARTSLLPVLVGVVAAVAAYSWAYWAYSADETCFGGGSLSRRAAFYFTLTTMTTTGYGDISPKSDDCRLLVSSHMIVNLTVIAALLQHVGTTAWRRSRPTGGQPSGQQPRARWAHNKSAEKTGLVAVRSGSSSRVVAPSASSRSQRLAGGRRRVPVARQTPRQRNRSPRRLKRPDPPGPDPPASSTSTTAGHGRTSHMKPRAGLVGPPPGA